MDIPVVRVLHLAWFLAGLPDWVHRSIYTNGIKLSYLFSKIITRGYRVQALLLAFLEKAVVDWAQAKIALVSKGFSNDFGGVN